MRWAALLNMEGNWILASGLTLLEKVASNLKVRQDRSQRGYRSVASVSGQSLSHVELVCIRE